ncbi:hypothetical protein GCM10023210_00490 [Chryseobacterium ginsengisoli]|uniref:HNH endonuclease n=1 Tax=Chryseobacterium ginsengisoli TaxID=363853 RepID=A0ABP9LPE5_9FLAO
MRLNFIYFNFDKSQLIKNLNKVDIKEFLEDNLKKINSKCFICFCDLGSDNLSKEHIIPKWLFKKFNQTNGEIKLGNSSNLKYQRLTIPACKDCNNGLLSEIEQDFKLILEENFTNLTFEDELTIAQWTLKVMLGTILKETILDKDIRNRGEKILSFEEIQKLIPLFILLQSVKYETKFENGKPWSLFITTFDSEDYDYQSHSFFKSASFKFGKIGFTITFDDSGYYKKAITNEFKFTNLSHKQFIVLAYSFFSLRSNELKDLTAHKEITSNILLIKNKKLFFKPKILLDKNFLTKYNHLIEIYQKRSNVNS